MSLERSEAVDVSNALALKGARIMVTGAAGGIGSAVCHLLGRLGASVAVCDVASPEAVTVGIREDGGAATSHQFDVTDRRAVIAARQAIGDVDAVVLGAGINPYADWHTDAWDEAFRSTMDVNILGAVNVVREMTPALAKSRAGRVVLIGSLVAANGGSGPHVPADYVISKGGIHALVRWFARRLAPDILVNAVAPGLTRTRMTAKGTFDMSRNPIARMAEPPEIAWPIAFLCSPRASFMCGAVIDVNGGAIMR